LDYHSTCAFMLDSFALVYIILWAPETGFQSDAIQILVR
jgi:hypothetical protein